MGKNNIVENQLNYDLSGHITALQREHGDLDRINLNLNHELVSSLSYTELCEVIAHYQSALSTIGLPFTVSVNGAPVGGDA
jgi:hypothetical protein